MALAITTDGTLTIADATGSSGVAYLSGIPDGATVTLGVTMSNGITVELSRPSLKGPVVVTHGLGATVVAKTVGAGGSTSLVLDFFPL